MDNDEIRQSLVDIQERINRLLERFERLGVGSENAPNPMDIAAGGQGTFVDKVADTQRGASPTSKERKG